MSDHALFDQCAGCPGAVSYRVEVAVMYKDHVWCLAPCEVKAGPTTPYALISEQAVKCILERQTPDRRIDFTSVRSIERVE
jgi:predicted metal-binding protein